MFNKKLLATIISMATVCSMAVISVNAEGYGIKSVSDYSDDYSAGEAAPVVEAPLPIIEELPLPEVTTVKKTYPSKTNTTVSTTAPAVTTAPTTTAPAVTTTVPTTTAPAVTTTAPVKAATPVKTTTVKASTKTSEEKKTVATTYAAPTLYAISIFMS